MSDLRNWCNGVAPFVWDRLPLGEAHDIGARSPCLREDWFVEDALAAGSPFIWRGRDPETSHRMLFRYARKQAHERGNFGSNPEHLLLHQMIELLPILFEGPPEPERTAA